MHVVTSRQAWLTFAAVLLMAAVVASPPATAADGGSVTAGGDSSGGAVTVGTVDQGGSPDDASGSDDGTPPYVNCEVIHNPQIAAWLSRDPTATDYQQCLSTVDGTTVLLPYKAKQPSTQDVVDVARAGLVVPAVDVGTAPPRGSLLLVGVSTWFWAKDRDDVTATASIPGLSATITATPLAMHLRFRDGDAVTCAQGGVAWRSGTSSADQHSSCTHVFQHPGRQRVEATVDWSLTWEASNGQTGALPMVSRTTSFTLDLRQAQAVTD